MKWLGILFVAAPLFAHVVSMSTGELRVSGNRARYEFRMPLYELQHVSAPQQDLFQRLRLFSNGIEGLASDRRCTEDRETSVLLCSAIYEFPDVIDTITVVCGFHIVTVQNHVHILNAWRDDKPDHAVFDFSNTSAELRFRPPTAFEKFVEAAAGGVARVFSSPASVLFLVCLALAARSRKELMLVTAMFLGGATLSALIVPHTTWDPAPRFVESALALTISYLAVEILLLPKAGQRWLVAGALGAFHGLSYALYLKGTGFNPAAVLSGMSIAVILSVALIAIVLWKAGKTIPKLAPLALRASSSLLLVFGIGWFIYRLRA